MQKPREYGLSPFGAAVIHGRPGAVGEKAPVARVLAAEFGVLEPLQTATTLEGQVEELKAVLEEHADLPVTLIGFSWGAWLSYIVTAKYPQLVKKLILVGSGPYEHHYIERIQEARMSRLTQDERVEYDAIITLLNDPHGECKAERFARLGQLAAKTDRYDPIDIAQSKPEKKQSTVIGNQFHGVLKEAQEMRKDGRLLKFADHIQCPVVALHGDYDPHPAEGVREPLSAKLKDFRMIMLDNCGHKPWIERQAEDQFYEILRKELHAASTPEMPKTYNGGPFEVVQAPV